jgi:uncharacterized protein YeaO (DUF488 family)
MRIVQIKRIYDPPASDDGVRILVDRLWPRGIKKEKAHVDEWAKDLAPSNELRRWFSHDPNKWAEFKKRYRKELAEKQEVLKKIRDTSRKRTITLIYAAKDTEHNNAVVLKEILSR